MRTFILSILIILFWENSYAQKQIIYPEYKGLVMCGYQGWFRAEGDEAGRGWGHFGVGNKFDPENITIDLWPDMTEYENKYPTKFVDATGKPLDIFSSVDKSTTLLHFKWMKDYGIDGVFMQRFFGYCRNEQTRKIPDKVLTNALEASQETSRAIAIMYDLSGLNPQRDNCSTLIEDWKHLVDDLHVIDIGPKQTYLHHHKKPLVAIWGIGFPDRPYNIRKIEIEMFIDFLKNDPVYGGCSVMLGVPTYFRELKKDCISDPYLHDIICSADIVMPWMVGRFTLNNKAELKQYTDLVRKDLEWCKVNKVDYVPCVYPGFSWYNLSKIEHNGQNKINQIPRRGGKFFWNQIYSTLNAGCQMLYVAMFDEIDEATAIFKCTNKPPVNGEFIDYEGYPTDHYLKLAGKAAAILKNKIPLKKNIEEIKK